MPYSCARLSIPGLASVLLYRLEIGLHPKLVMSFKLQVLSHGRDSSNNRFYQERRCTAIVACTQADGSDKSPYYDIMKGHSN